MTQLKKCSKCKIDKVLGDFGKNSQQKSGLNPSCKKCRPKYSSEYYYRNKEHIAKRSAQWAKDNPKKQKVYAKRHQAKDTTKEANWKRSIWSKFKLTPEDYTAILNSQSGVCYICRKTPEENGKRLAVDHCHATGDIRGILCDTCNTGLGMFKDNITLLRKAQEYLLDL